MTMTGPGTTTLPAFSICILNSVFNEVAASLRHGLGELGHPTEVLSGGFVQGSRPIILGAQLIADWSKLPDEAIIFNFEQLGVESRFITPEYLAQLSRRTVWDYSPRNIDWLRAHGINDSARLIRIGHAPDLVRVPAATEQDIDVLFYGAVNERRRHILQALHDSGLRLVMQANLFGEERDRTIGRAKVVLNLHYYETRIFEIARVGYLLANGKAVVTEGGSDTELEPDLREAMLAVPYEELVGACQALVADAQRRHALEARAAGIFAARSQANFLCAAVADALATPTR